MNRKLYPTKDPLMPLYLSGGVVASALACAIATELPSIPKVALATAGLSGCVGVVRKTLLLEKETPMLDRNEQLLNFCHQKQLQCAASYYKRYPKALEGAEPKPVSDSWHEQYAIYGGPPPLGLPPAGTPMVPLSSNNSAVALASAMTNPDYIAKELATMPELHYDLEALTGEAPIDTNWVTSLFRYPYVLIQGPPASGKTTFVQWLINQRIALGHKVFVLDPHFEAGSWQFCEVKGAGLQYKEIDEFIERLTLTVKRRYIERQEKRGLIFEPITVVCEELTEWADNCEKVQQLIKKIPDYRKVAVHLLLVAHGRSLPSLGGAKGKRDMLDAALAELKLLVKTGPNGEPEPLMKGILKLPHLQPQEVRIPNIYIPEPEPGEPPSPEPGTQTVQEVQPLAVRRFEVREPAEPTKLRVVPEPEPERSIEISDIEQSQFFKLREEGKNQETIIDLIWDCRKGGGARYKKAKAKYELLLASENETA